MPARGYILITVEFFEQDGQWVGRCRELGTSTCADSFQGAVSALREAVELQLNTLEELGERERFFRKHHITLYPRRSAVKERKVDVPVGTEHEMYVSSELIPVGAC